MSAAPGSRASRVVLRAGAAAALLWLAMIFWHAGKPLPPGTHFVSQTIRLSEADLSWVGGAAALSSVDRAGQMIVVDQSPVGAALAQRLAARKRLRPNMKIVVVTDPANEVFGGTPAQTLRRLEEAGIIVVRVRLERLRDSNPLYSGFWRIGFEWWSDPFDEAPGVARLSAWARMQNLKRDQRQLLIADDGSGGWSAVLGAAGGFAALQVHGALPQTMLQSELQIAAWSSDDDRIPAPPPSPPRGVGAIDARFLSEGATKGALIDILAGAGAGDEISIAVHDLGERSLIQALEQAARRGAHVKIALARAEVPNQAVAAELERAAGIEIRWLALDSRAAPLRLLTVRHRADLWANLGSANFTRRNLDDLNLEAGVELRLPLRSQTARAIGEYFAQIWAAASADPDFADESPAAYWRYRLLEAVGLASF